MKKKLKFLFTFIFCGLIVCCMTIFTGCNGKKDEKSTEAQIKEVYAMAVEAGYTGTYEEWLASIKGEAGADGREVELSVSDTYIQWRYKGESKWKDLVLLDDIKGSKGKDGTDGRDGKDGREVEFQKTETNIQWRYVGETSWNDLVALKDIKGEQGVQGEKGDKGDNSNYELYCSYKVNYKKSELEWLNDLVMGKLAPIATENYGDVDGNGNVDLSDVLIINAMVSNSETYPASYYARADVDLNGVIDYRDSRCVVFCRVNYCRDILPISYQYGDINLDGVVDELDYELLNNDSEYSSFSLLQKLLSNMGYNYTREQSLEILRDYLDGVISSLDEHYHFVTIDYNGFETTLETKYRVKNGELLQLTNPSRTDNCEFKGWVYGSKLITDNNELVFSDIDNTDITLIAYWEDTTAGVSQNLEINDGVLVGLGTNSDTSLIIPRYSDGKQVTKISFSPDVTNNTITSITIPETINSIMNSSFANFTGTESIVVSSKNKTYDSRENCNAIIETASNKLIASCKKTTIPTSVTALASLSLQNSSFVEFTISEQFTSLESLSFNKSNIVTLTITNQTMVSDDYNGDYVTYGMNKLQTIICDNQYMFAGAIEVTLQEIGNNSLTKIYLKSDLHIESIYFSNFTKQDSSDLDGYDLWTINSEE